MGSMRAAFAGAGGKQDVFSGEIWVVADRRLTFADFDETRRTYHETRYVLVMQGDEVAENAGCPTVLVAPLSSHTERKRSWEDMLSLGETPLMNPSIVKLHLIQPIPRRALVDDGSYVGSIDDAVLARLRVHLLTNLGIV